MSLPDRAGSLLLETTDHPVLFTDPEGTIQFVNPAFEDLTGFSAEEAVGENPRILKSGLHSDDFYQDMWETIRAGEVWKGELTNRRKDGTLYHVDQTITPVHDDGGDLMGFVAQAVDITPRVRAHEELRNRALHDELTELPNRALLHNRLQQALDRLERDPEQGFTLMFLDIDQFRRVNDSLGHAEGDRILQEIARRLDESVRPGDTATRDTAARFGGDEFILLLRDTHDLHDAEKITRRLLRKIREPIVVEGRKVKLDATAGIVLSSPDYEDPDTMIRDADTAMYRAKHKGTDFEFFTESMHDRMLKQFRLGIDLREALENEQFELHYQPIVSMDDGTLEGFEALIRWHHPEEGFKAPADFIPEAERSGLIVPLGRWVLRQATTRLNRWRHDGLIDEDVFVNVNHSPRELSEPDFLDQIQSVLQDVNLPRERLNLEFTESTVGRNIDFMDSRMERLSSLGLRLCVDDFGTGYSSIARLSRWPIDFLKIDYSFVSGMCEEPQQRDLTRGIVEFARRIDLDVIAEGVERPEEHEMLQSWGCPIAQGFYYARPMPPGDVETALRSSTNGQVTWSEA